MKLRVGRQSIEVRRTIADHVVSWFDPGRGFERLKSRAMLAAATGENGGYKGGRRDRRNLKRWRPSEASADADIMPDLPDLRGRARDLRRNTPIATGALLTDITNVIGDGLQLQACVDHEALGLTAEQADAIERAAEREWRLFSASCDFSRVQNFAELQALAYGSSRDSGDVFVLRRYRRDAGDAYGTKLQVIEADRVSNPHRAADSPTMTGGVEMDTHGVPIAVHVTDKHPGGRAVASLQWERVPVRTEAGKQVVLHLFERMRPEQTRGVPYLAPVIEHLKVLGDYSDAECTAALVSAMFTVAIETPDDGGDANPIIGERKSDLAADEVALGAGAVLSLAPGEKMHEINPGRPNAQFDPFVTAILRQVGVALELPFELLIKHFTASYSASRAALEMAWQTFRRRRTWFARRFCQAAYEWMWEEAVASGRLAAPGFFADPLVAQAYRGAQWIGPPRASIDPLKEAKADEVDIALGVTTREEICARRTGGEWENKHRQLVKESASRDRDGLTPPPAAPAARAADQPEGDDGAGDRRQDPEQGDDDTPAP